MESITLPCPPRQGVHYKLPSAYGPYKHTKFFGNKFYPTLSIAIKFGVRCPEYFLSQNYINISRFTYITCTLPWKTKFGFRWQKRSFSNLDDL